MFRVSRLLVAAALTLAVAAPASAAAPLAPLFTTSGVINNNGLGTFFTCTNTDTAATTVGVEVFGQNGSSLNNPNTTAVSLSPQATVMFGTTTAGGLAVDADLGMSTVTKGSARILTTSKKMVCTAFVADVNNAPPISMTNLTMAAKGKQKGD